MSEPFLAEINMFGGNFAPRGWAKCDGQLLAISQYSAVFSLLGTIYGGDGRTTFGLPDMRGRVPMHEGTGPGLSQRRLGERGGAENVALNAQQMPSHNHTATLHAESKLGDASISPSGKLLARGVPVAEPDPGDNRTMAADSIIVQNNGGNQGHPNMQPYLAVNFIIALQGIYPSRS